MSFVDPVGRSDPAPVPTPAEHKPSQTPTPSGGEVKPDAQAELPGIAADPTEQTPADDAGAETDVTKREEATPRRNRHPSQERISELTADKRRLERENEKLLERVLKGNDRPAQSDPATAQTGDLKEPREEDFTDYGKYLHARDEFLVERTRRATAKEFEDRQKADERTRSEDQMRTSAREARQRFDEAANKVAEQYEDFADVMDDLFPPDKSETRLPFMMNNHIARFVFEEAERGPELVYHLDANPKEAKRIAALTSPLAVARELTKLEAAMPQPKARTVTNAPRPPKEIKGGGSDKLDEEKMSIAQMRAAGIGGKRKVDY